MAKRRSKTAEQQAKFYEVGDTAESFYEYLVQSFDNGNFSQYKELFSEMNLFSKKGYILWLLKIKLSDMSKYVEKLY